MARNKSMRIQLEQIYGKECMFKKANIEEQVKRLGIKIKGYKVFVGEQRYKGKKLKRLETTLTYHHLQHQSEGGDTTIENGAVINEMAHRYIHSLPRDQEEIINDMLRTYKKGIEIRGGILVPTGSSLEIIQPLQVELNFDIDTEDCIIIPAYDTKEEEKPEKFNRAKVKQKSKHLIEEGLYDYEHDIDD